MARASRKASASARVLAQKVRKRKLNAWAQGRTRAPESDRKNYAIQPGG